MAPARVHPAPGVTNWPGGADDFDGAAGRVEVSTSDVVGVPDALAGAGVGAMAGATATTGGSITVAASPLDGTADVGVPVPNPLVVATGPAEVVTCAPGEPDWFATFNRDVTL